MDFIRNIKKYEYEMKGEAYFKLINMYIELNFDESIPIEYIESCVNCLNSLSENIISNICYYSLEFCKDVMKNYEDVEYNEGLAKISNAKDILNYIEPVSLNVDEPDDLSIPAINLYCKCDWDQDNDMQILIKDNQILYVGVFDGLDAWQTNLSDWGNYVTGYKL
jgi:hypothetical protein